MPNSVKNIGCGAFVNCDLKVNIKKDSQDRIIAYKGFFYDMTCRDFQYKTDKTYVYEDETKLCARGFHACLNPLDVFNYYAGDDVVYHEVYLRNVNPKRSKKDSKVVAAEITIGRELSTKDLIYIYNEIKL